MSKELHLDNPLDWEVIDALNRLSEELILEAFGDAFTDKLTVSELLIHSVKNNAMFDVIRFRDALVSLRDKGDISIEGDVVTLEVP